MKGKSMKTYKLPHFAAGLAAATLLGTACISHADVLYDTTWMITDMTATITDSAVIGGLGAGFSEPIDDQVADDFVVPNGPGHHITSVTGAFVTTTLGGQLPADGLLIEFFADSGSGSPQENAAFAVMAENYTATPFTEFGSDDMYYLSADLTNENIQLDAGTWWMSITPMDLSDDGGLWRQFRQTGFVEGNGSHYRGGGEAHGTGFGSTYGDFEWTLNTLGGGPGDLAMKVEGAILPTPSAIALLALAGLFGRGRQRPSQL